METLELKTNNNRIITKKDPTKMTKEEFFARADRAKEQCDRGEYTEVKYEDISKYLDGL